MADEQTVVEGVDEAPGGSEAPGREEATDYQAKYESMRRHAREWEKKAKANAAAAEELQKLKDSQMSELERAQSQYEAEKARADALQSEKDRAQWVSEISKDTGVPADLLGLIAADTREELAEIAAGLAERYGARGGAVGRTVPVVLGDGRHADHEAPKGDFIREQFLNMHRR